MHADFHNNNPSMIAFERIERDFVHVRVPATSANMGPGFDCMGLALDVWNELTVERCDVFSMTVEGEGEGNIPLDETNLVVVGLKAAFEDAGKEIPTCKYHLKNNIPFCRGLGSSSAAIVAGLIAGLVLSGHELKVKGEESLLQLACKIEGHPDNVAPAIYGGLQIVRYESLLKPSFVSFIQRKIRK